MKGEERKKIIYACPRSNVMNYSPPALNDSATSAVKRTDSLLYGIQSSLVSITRPIDYYIYQKHLERKEQNISESPDIEFATTIRSLLADLASQITQARRDMVYKIMELPGRTPQLADLKTNTLLDQEEFDNIIETKKKEKKPRPFRRRPFQQRQQYAGCTEHSGTGIQNPIPNKKCNKFYRTAESKSAPKNLEHPTINNAPVSLQEEDDQGSKRPTNNGGSITTIKEGNRRGKDKNTRFLQPAFYYPKEDWWAQADSRLTELK
ncbi:hypothetical protein BB560_006805 [Smittium megazygosporum]|uniref:Uncharacterized protein n=1 Tax=Smittium megazygosporum TaxID=133381 RepID=A0A2T9Y1B7_9FUNG|nr:hypothetical protein BB560_006805 [Smittium megazygosporum]